MMMCIRHVHARVCIYNTHKSPALTKTASYAHLICHVVAGNSMVCAVDSDCPLKGLMVRIVANVGLEGVDIASRRQQVHVRAITPCSAQKLSVKSAVRERLVVVMHDAAAAVGTAVGRASVRMCFKHAVF